MPDKKADAEFNTEMAERLAKILGGMTIVGAGARGLAAAASPPISALTHVPPVRKIIVPIPVDGRAGPEEPDGVPVISRRPMLKGANDLAPSTLAELPAQGFRLTFPDFLAKHFPETAKAWNDYVPNYHSITGSDAQKVTEHPWFWPAAMASGAGGLYGGWSLADNVLRRNAKSKADHAVDNARADYETQVLSGYGKQSAVNSAIEQVYDVFEKMAVDDTEHSLLARWLWPLNHGGSMGAGATATIMGLSAAIPALGAYNYTRNTNLANAKQKALLDLERDDAENRAPVVVGKLVPKKPTTNETTELPAVMGR